MINTRGYFVISLDFELFWGMLDKKTLAEYGERIRGERTAIPRMLSLFEQYGIHATWGTVGMLMARNKTELAAYLPETNLQPKYRDGSASSYSHLMNTEIEETDIHYFGHDLVKKIMSTPFQEIGNHTFSHFYCLDELSQNINIVSADLVAFNRIAQTYETTPTSIIFPRNQYTEETISILKHHGIHAYRGNENHILYRARKDTEQSALIRLLRLFDHYFNISSYHTYPLPKKTGNVPINIPASRFFRPWNSVLQILEPLRMRRITRAMTHAAKKGEVFHLWWHPHNVGIDQEQNFSNLEKILKHYAFLKKTYGMESASMKDITTHVS